MSSALVTGAGDLERGGRNEITAFASSTIA